MAGPTISAAQVGRCLHHRQRRQQRDLTIQRIAAVEGEGMRRTWIGIGRKHRLAQRAGATIGRIGD